LISDEELKADYVIPDPFDPRVAAHVAAAVAFAAMETEVAQRIVNVEDIKNRLLEMAEQKQPALF
jgi:malate dehydrogenase (oxaloacetate-decarboxylating)